MGRAHEHSRLEALARLAALVVALVAATSGCAGGQSAPRTLVDGSPAAHARIALEGVDGPVLLSRTHAADASTLDSRSRDAMCLRDAWTEDPAGAVVHRIGVLGESVTFRSRSDRSLRACDGTRSADAGARSWCGHSFGRLRGGRLRDPRLDLGGCRNEVGEPVAFAWVEPGPGTRYVVVNQAGFGEAYEAAASLAVRVATTTGIDEKRSSAAFDVSEHSADGRRLRAYELETSVSG